MPVDPRRIDLDIANQSALAPMDEAIQYLRDRPWRVLGPYLLGMTLYSVAVLAVIDVIASQHRAAIPEMAAMLTVATAWRWVWVAVAQRRVQEDLLNEPPPALWRRLPRLLWVRLWANFALVWGGLVVIPAYYGLFLSGFATPMVLEQETHTWPQIKNTLSVIHKASGRLTRVTSAMTVTLLLLAVSVFALQVFMVHTVLPSLLGLDSADLALTMSSWSWFLCMCYFLFVAVDLYWSVLAVVLFNTIKSRRLGTDLRARLRDLEQPNP